MKRHSDSTSHPTRLATPRFKPLPIDPRAPSAELEYWIDLYEQKQKRAKDQLAVLHFMNTLIREPQSP